MRINPGSIPNILLALLNFLLVFSRMLSVLCWGFYSVLTGNGSNSVFVGIGMSLNNWSRWRYYGAANNSSDGKAGCQSDEFCQVCIILGKRMACHDISPKKIVIFLYRLKEEIKNSPDLRTSLQLLNSILILSLFWICIQILLGIFNCD